MSGDVPMFRLGYDDDGDMNDPPSTGEPECPPSKPIAAAPPTSDPEAEAGPVDVRLPSDGSILLTVFAFEYVSESRRETCVGMIIVSRVDAGGADAGPDRSTASSTIRVRDTPEAAPIK